MRTAGAVMAATGQSGRPSIRRRDKAVTCRLDDGTALALHPDRLHLDGPRPPSIHLLRRFVDALCRRLGWKRVATLRHLAIDRMLAGSHAARHRWHLRRLGRARVHALSEDAADRQRVTDRFRSWLAQDRPLPSGSADSVLVLTAACFSMLRADPAAGHARIRDQLEQDPGLLILYLAADDSMPRPISPARLLGALADRAEPSGATSARMPSEPPEDPADGPAFQ